MKSYTTAAEDAKAIRAEYKALGWTIKDVSVRSESYSMGSSINVRIRTEKVDRAQAEEIAKRIAERIDRDQFGSILSGGNRFVSVRISDELSAIYAERWQGPVAAALARFDGQPSSSLYPVEGTDGRVLVGLRTPHHAGLWIDGRHDSEFYPGHPAQAANRISAGLARRVS